jgi:hypothetical protein
MVGRPELMRIKLTKLFGAALGIALFMATPAFAQQVNPTQDAYSITAARVQEQVQQTHESAGALPFTGMTLGIMLAVGVALLLTGLVVRRASRGPTSA